MNLLTERLPKAIEIDGKEYPIYTDFRNWIRFEILMLDNRVPFEDKAVDLLKLCYIQLPDDLESALFGTIRFYAGAAKDGDEGGKEGKSPIYSFRHDSEYIYAAFLGQYDIDLQTKDLHWWQFKALFKSLNDSNQIVKIMEYRSVNLAKIKDKEQKAFYRKMRSLYRLPDERSEEQKERDMVRGLEALF